MACSIYIRRRNSARTVAAVTPSLDRSPDKSKTFAAGVPALLAFGNFEPKPVTLPVDAFSPESRAYVERDRIAHHEAQLVVVGYPGAALAARQRVVAEGGHRQPRLPGERHS